MSIHLQLKSCTSVITNVSSVTWKPVNLFPPQRAAVCHWNHGGGGHPLVLLWNGAERPRSPLRDCGLLWGADVRPGLSPRHGLWLADAVAALPGPPTESISSGQERRLVRGRVSCFILLLAGPCGQRMDIQDIWLSSALNGLFEPCPRVPESSHVCARCLQTRLAGKLDARNVAALLNNLH